MDDRATATSLSHHDQLPAGDSGGLSRRLFLAGVSGAAVLGSGLVATPAAAAATTSAPTAARTGGARHGSGSTDRAMAFLRTMTDAYPAVNPGPRLPQSYADELGLFSTAFIYDVALSVCAALTGGRRSLDLARTMGDGIVYAQENDPGYDDGRLRQGYNVGPYVFYDGIPQPYGFVLPDGNANIGFQFGFLGTAVGDMAWPGIALVQLYRRTRRRKYLDAAVRIGEWIVTNATSPGSLGGFNFGVNGSNVSIPNVSTEHNIDCVSFFGQLRQATGDARWRAAATRARGFVDRMWSAQGGYFFTGSNDGDTINPTPLPLDPQTWSWLALRDRRYSRALEWAGSALAVTDDATAANSQVPPGVTISGVTFSSASKTSTASYNGIQVNQRGVWLEGTAQLATSLADRGGRRDRLRADAILRQVRIAQRSLGFGSAVGTQQHVGGTELADGGGVVAASSLIDSGFGFGYFRVQHTGATAWYLMAAARANPMQYGEL
ncbi:Tat pathway signal sequence domain protein [Nakamurella sp. GG22]